MHSIKPVHSLELPFYSPLCVCLCCQDQFEQHMRADVKINVYLYYGTDRNRSKKFLSSQDVVITTYNVLSTDFGVSESGLCHVCSRIQQHGAMLSSCVYIYKYIYILCRQSIPVLKGEPKCVNLPQSLSE